MERMKPAMEQISAVRSPLNWLSEGSFGTAQSQARRMEDGACWQQGPAEEVAGAQLSNPPTQPTQFPARRRLGQQPTAAQSLLMKK